MKIMRQMSSVMVRAMLILALVIGLAPLAEAQTMAAKGKPAATKAKSPASANPSGGPQDGSASSPQEGIKVHGRWTIEVRNPDGTVVERREFENSLTSTGGQILASVLGPYGTVSNWKIEVSNACGSNTSPSGCMIDVTPNVPTTGGTSPRPTGTVEFAGSTTATHDASITSVWTAATFAGPGGSISTLLPFTASGLSSPLNVVSGQIIQVKVVISFS